MRYNRIIYTYLGIGEGFRKDFHGDGFSGAAGAGYEAVAVAYIQTHIDALAVGGGNEHPLTADAVEQAGKLMQGNGMKIRHRAPPEIYFIIIIAQNGENIKFQFVVLSFRRGGS